MGRTLFDLEQQSVHVLPQFLLPFFWFRLDKPVLMLSDGKQIGFPALTLDVHRRLRELFFYFFDTQALVALEMIDFFKDRERRIAVIQTVPAATACCFGQYALPGVKIYGRRQDIKEARKFSDFHQIARSSFRCKDRPAAMAVYFVFVFWHMVLPYPQGVYA